MHLLVLNTQLCSLIALQQGCQEAATMGCSTRVGGWQLVVMGGLAGQPVPDGTQSHGSQTRRKEERQGWRVAQPAIQVAGHVCGDEAGLGSREVRSVSGDHVCDSNQAQPPPSDLQASPSWWGKAKVRVLAWWTNGSGKDSCSRSKYWYIAGFCY